MSFDLHLASFEAGVKIKIIKEVRSLFGLGLKEAKELVDKTPVDLKKNISKSEATELKEKLEKLGCKIELN